jgi:hypothetical protein
MKRHPSIEKLIPGIFLFLLLMGGCTRKVSFGISNLGCYNRPFLVGDNK